MDDSEDALGKISRQLSELAAAPNSSGSPSVHSAPVASPSGSGQWTQFSGISPQAGQPPFRSLYTWNSMDSPDFKPLSPPRPNIDSNLTQFPSEAANFSGRGPDFHNRSQFDWHRENPSQPRFQVTGDLAGRLVDMSRNRVPGGSFDHQNYHVLGQGGFQPPDPVFHYDGTNPGANMPLHRQMSQPSSPGPFTGTDRSGRLSAPSSSNVNMLSHNIMHGGLPPEGMPLNHGSLHDGIGQGIPIDSLSHGHLLQTPPVFDPSTPPPVFPVPRQPSEKSHSQTSSLSSNTSHDDIIEYLRMQGNTNINLDLGISIDRGSRQPFPEADDTHAVAEGRQMYESAMKQWHSFDSPGLTPVDSLNATLAPSPRPDSVPEPAISDSAKPTYSDIAKTPKPGPALSVKPDQSGQGEGTTRVPGPKPVKKEGKPFRPPVKRTSSGSRFWPRGSLGGDADQPRMSPSSRYGLDNFDDHLLGPGSHSSSSESLVQVNRSRRGSGSSAGSSVSALDEVSSPGATARASNSETDAPHQTAGNQEHKQASHSATKPALSSKPPRASASSAPSETLFFDPRRIFQCKNTNKSRVQTQSQSSSKSETATTSGLDDFGVLPSSSDTVLNNGKPTASTSSSKLSSSARQHDYINNDLRDASKLTNQTAAEISQGMSGKGEEVPKHKESRSGRRSGNRTNGVYRRDRRKSPNTGQKNAEESGDDDVQQQRQRLGFLSEYVDSEMLEEWCGMAKEKLSHWGNLFINTLLNLLIYIVGLVLFLATSAVHLFRLLVCKCWMLVKDKVFKGYFGPKEGTTWNSRDYMRRRVGLEDNISLPATGDEAMKRLLACKGKDPYSILGLRADASDEDIKKYYRKQAVLVHPDKNQEPGAEEAFKVLGHAFEMIGEPAKRKQYDSHAQEASEAEAMREFAEMLSKLQTKIQEATNIMRCDNCGGKHRRVPVDRPFYSARSCQRCNTRHSAKEGDVWAESTMLGFYWHYYALMEGHVYDITEWMKCHREYFKHMKANAHAVMYKIATDGNRRSKHHQSGEANLEDFINRLFNKSSAASGDGPGPSWGNPHSAGTGSWGQGGASTSSAAAAAAAKRGRRKKKRH